MSDLDVWVEIADVEQVPVDRGVAALVGGVAVAIFRLRATDTEPESWFCIQHADPVTGSPVLARGLVGSRGDVPTVASPIYKERYDLRTGVGLDDPTQVLRTHEVRVAHGVVSVRLTAAKADIDLTVEKVTAG
ncbi:MAG: nitrite reductase small subunit NirD [Actinomycetota bacterium]